MVSILNSWAKGIILVIIIATIIEIILPEGNNKKYIKTILGVYLMFVMISPFLNKKININSIIKDTTVDIENYETKDLKLETNQYIKETYQNKIREDIHAKLKNKGYKIISLKLDLEIKNEEFYGEVKEINVQISKINNMEDEQSNIENTIQEIENIEINLSNNLNVKEKINKEIDDDELDELKLYLSNEYGTAKEKIYINK